MKDPKNLHDITAQPSDIVKELSTQVAKWFIVIPVNLFRAYQCKTINF